MRRYHLHLLGERWELIQEDVAVAIRSFWTKKEGVSYGLAFIEQHGGSLTIHRLDGSLQEERTYPHGLKPTRATA